MVRPSRLGVLYVIKEKGKKTQAVCECACGVVKKIVLSHVKSGYVKSCGCLKLETSKASGKANKKHGHAGQGAGRSPTYRSWESMKARCLNSKDPSYHLYGSRGITVCDEWLVFEQFLSDMGERPSGRSLDRINNDLPYRVDNCRWATPSEQSRNKRSNRVVIFNDVPMLMIELAERTCLPYSELWELIVRKGLTPEQAIKRSQERKVGSDVAVLED